MTSIAASLNTATSFGPPTTTDKSRNSDQPSGTQKAPNLSEEEARQLAKLRERDREVRAHEAAHLAVAGSFAIGGANLQLTRGPDGGLYATGGDVQIDISAVSGDPAATMRKAETIRRAALAPASPSPQDHRVADMAGKMAMAAQMELAQKTRSESRGGHEAATYTNVASTSEPQPNLIDQVA